MMQGKTVAILASGTSMNQQVADATRDCYRIAINDTYKLAPDADMLYAADPEWWLTHPEAFRFRGRKVTARNGILAGVEYVKPRAIPGGGNSALRAAHLASDEGAEKILLFGVDLNDDALTHWHGQHPKPLHNPTRSRFAAARAAWERFAGEAERPPVYNCSPSSALTCFPRYQNGSSANKIPMSERRVNGSPRPLLVYSAVFGYTDPLQEPLIPGDARYICFTDQDDVRSSIWEIIKVPHQTQPTRASRALKLLSHLLFPDHDMVLWVDAALVLKVNPYSLVEQATQDIVTLKHPWRKRITDEADEIIRLQKANAESIRLQLQDYHHKGFDTPDNPQQSLGAHGIVFRRHTDAVKALNEFWFGEVSRHTLRDQMSLDYSAWSLNVPIGRFNGSCLSCDPIVNYRPFTRPVNDY
jgi:hypothetical protein